MEDITIQDLITEQKNRISTLQYHDAMLPYYDYPDMDSYYKWLEKAKRFIEINYPDDKHIADFERLSDNASGLINKSSYWQFWRHLLYYRLQFLGLNLRQKSKTRNEGQSMLRQILIIPIVKRKISNNRLL